MIHLQHIGKSADDLRFFITLDGQHAGGITVHSVAGDRFSYGIVVVREFRGRGIAKEALTQLFALMKARGFARAVADVAPDNAASLALHRALGFQKVLQDKKAVTLIKIL